jgi:hypothetical protein
MRLFITLLILACQPVYSQQKGIYVSTEGGGRSLFSLGRIAYQDVYFKSNESGTDTLLCSGKRLELCRLNALVRQANPELDELYRAYNKAILKSKRQIKRAEVARKTARPAQKEPIFIKPGL